jgi:predicted Zn-dependent protease
MFSGRQFKEAYNLATECLKSDPSHHALHLLTAQIALENNQIGDAKQSLEAALSADFNLRHTIPYQRVSAKLLWVSNDTEGALRILIPLLESRDTPESDRNAVTVEVIQLYRDTHQSTLAQSCLTSALSRCTKHSDTEASLLLLQSEITGDTSVLNPILAGSYSNEYKHAARIKLAHTLLTNGQRGPYIQLFKEWAHTDGSATALMGLASAYMRIDDTSAAIRVYESIIQKFPNHAAEALRCIGSAWMGAHEYAKALEFYERAAKNDDGLKVALADAYRVVRRYTDAQSVLQSVLVSTQG